MLAPTLGLLKRGGLTFVALFLCAQSAFSKEPASLWRTLADHSMDTVEGAFDRTGLILLSSGAALTIAAHQLDSKAKDKWGSNQLMDSSVSQVGNFWGYGFPHITSLIVIYFYDRKTLTPALESLVFSQAANLTLKLAVARERPNGENNHSMPSGHTQSSFTLATIVSSAYGWKAATPFWLMAGFTGLSRIADDKHWLSDVVAGATLGIVFGRAGFQHHRLILPQVVLHEGQVQGLVINFQVPI